MASEPVGNSRYIPADWSNKVPSNRAMDPAVKPSSGLLAFKGGRGPGAAPPQAPKAPKQKIASGDVEKVKTTLNEARAAQAAYDKAAEEFSNLQSSLDSQKQPPSEKQLAEINRLKHDRESRLQALSRAEIELSTAVDSATMRSCSKDQKCDFDSARAAAAKLDEAVSNEGSALQAQGKMKKSEAVDRQVALRNELNSSLAATAKDNLTAIGPKDRAQLIKQVASWVVVQQEFPAATTPFGRLGLIIVGLQVYREETFGSSDNNNQRAGERM